MSPPGLVAAPKPGGTTTRSNALTGSQIELVTRAAHKALSDSGVEISPSKVTRIIRRFGHALNRNKVTFHEFLSDAANLTVSQRRRVVGNSDLARAIAYMDPTGEAAVNSVMRERGH